MRPNSQFPADLVTFTEEILNGKLHFLGSETFESNVLKTLNLISKMQWHSSWKEADLGFLLIKLIYKNLLD